MPVQRSARPTRQRASKPPIDQRAAPLSHPRRPDQAPRRQPLRPQSDPPSRSQPAPARRTTATRRRPESLPRSEQTRQGQDGAGSARVSPSRISQPDPRLPPGLFAVRCVRHRPSFSTIDTVAGRRPERCTATRSSASTPQLECSPAAARCISRAHRFLRRVRPACTPPAATTERCVPSWRKAHRNRFVPVDRATRLTRSNSGARRADPAIPSAAAHPNPPRPM